DMGHCGKNNIRISWIFVKLMLILNYFGQGAWLLENKGLVLGEINPFYAIMPDWFVVWGVTIATIAAVIASQAMISGSFTLIAEAGRLNLWPKVTIGDPGDHKGQIYVPAVNLILYLGCMLIILIFRESSNMEAAYGLSINMPFIMTTILMTTFMLRKKINIAFIALFAGVYMVIEVAFLVGNISKIAQDR